MYVIYVAILRFVILETDILSHTISLSVYWHCARIVPVTGIPAHIFPPLFDDIQEYNYATETKSVLTRKYR